jgi:hypothetical protein
MKVLVTATLTDQAVLDKLADWMREQQQAGRIMAAYSLVGRRLLGHGCRQRRGAARADGPVPHRDLTCPSTSSR